MSQGPFFSVVIPTYNRAGLIGKTLNTVFAQTYAHYEVIVVDNCSDDDTEQLLQPLIAAGRIRFIKHERNYERARSRNTGMGNARGDFVTFLDSDDLMYPSNLEDAAAYVAAHPDSKVFHNLYHLVDSDGNVLYKYSFPKLDNPLRAIADGNFLSCIGVFIHRDVYQRYRFDTDVALSGSEDWEFWLRVVADHRPGRIPKINSGIVHHGGRTVVGMDVDKVRQRLDYMVSKVESDPHLGSVYREYLSRLKVSSLIYAATVANSGRQHKEALRLLREAYRTDPASASSVRLLKALRIALFRINKR